MNKMKNKIKIQSPTREGLVEVEGTLWTQDGGVPLYIVRINGSWRIYEPQTGLPVGAESKTKYGAQIKALAAILNNGGWETVKKMINKHRITGGDNE